MRRLRYFMLRVMNNLRSYLSYVPRLHRVFHESSLSVLDRVYGLSLGRAVAINVASRNVRKIAALALKNTFASILEIDLAFNRPPLLHLHTQHWNFASKIGCVPPRLPTLLGPLHICIFWSWLEVTGRRVRGAPHSSAGNNRPYYSPFQLDWRVVLHLLFRGSLVGLVMDDKINHLPVANESTLWCAEAILPVCNSQLERFSRSQWPSSTAPPL